jgi:hypothetical protein
MNKVFIAAAAAAIIAPTALLAAPVANAQQPAQGDQCWTWHATTQDSSGQTLTCVHTPTTGHLTYWEYGGPSDSQ